MKTLVGLIALLSLVGVDAAVARVQTVMQTGHGGAVQAMARVSYRAPAPGVRQASVKQKVRRKGRRAAPRKVLVTRRALPSRPAEKRTLALRDDQAAGAPSQPGWFKAPGRAGYGVSKGGTETMVGLYTRPERPDLPGPQIYHTEPRGAAGVSLSLKLGH